MIFDLLFDEPQYPDEQWLVRCSRRAMATTFEIAFPLGTPHAQEAGIEALDLIDTLEDQLTIYRETSEISNLNRLAGQEPVVVETKLFQLLQHSTTLTRDTGGAFDIAIGALIRCWGFQQRAGRIPTEAELAVAASQSGSRHLVLDERTQSIRYLRPDLMINLGAVGKGYALDRAAELLRTKWGISSALLHAGGSSVCAIGHPPDDPRGWSIRIRHPWREDSLGTVMLRDRGFATSAATFQYFEYEGKKYGHVIDPRTARPAEGTQSASCVAPTAAEADAISTACFVAGADWARDYLQSRLHLSAVILTDAGDVVKL